MPPSPGHLVRVLIPGVLPGHDARDIVTAQAPIIPSSTNRARPSGFASTRCACAQAGNVNEGVEVAYTHAAGGGPGLSGAGQGLRAGRLEHDDPLSLPGDAGGPEGGAAQAGQDAAGLYQRGDPRLAGVQDSSASVPSPRRAAITASSISTSRWISAATKVSAIRRRPMLVHMTRTPAKPGLPEREQHKAGRAELLVTPF